MQNNAVLITRPLHDSLALQSQLHMEGYYCLIAPMLSIRPYYHAYEELKQVADEGVQAIVASSRNTFVPLPAVAALMDRPLYIVGQQTAAAAMAQGWQEPAVIAESSRDLMPHLRTLEPELGIILYLRGEVVAADLSMLLPEYHWLDIIAYQSVGTQTIAPTVAQALLDGQVTTVMFFSPRTALMFEHAAKHSIRDALPVMQALCISQEVADTLEGDYWRDKIIADAPNMVSILTRLKEIHKPSAAN